MSDKNISPQLRKKYEYALVERKGDIAFRIVCPIWAIAIYIAYKAENGSPSFLVLSIITIIAIAILVNYKIQKIKEIKSEPDDKILHEYDELSKSKSRTALLWILGAFVVALAFIFTPSGNAFVNALLGSFIAGFNKS